MFLDAIYMFANWWISTVPRFGVFNKRTNPLLQIGVTNICNAKCTFCAYPKTTLNRGVMSMATFMEAIRLWKTEGQSQIDLTPTVGDPLIDPKIVEKVKAAKEAGMSVSFTTNAILLDKFSRGLIDAGLDHIFISLPGFDRETYRNVYGVDQADQVRSSILKFLMLNKMRGEPCRVRIRFRNSQRPSEIMMSSEYLAVRNMLSERVRVNFTVGFDNWGGTVRESDLHGVMRMKKAVISNKPCVALRNISVLHDGTLRACGCRFVENEVDDLVIGHLNEGFYPARSRARELAKRFKSGDRPRTCQKCTFYNPG